MEEIFVPALGMAMEEATLVDWLKQPGDPVEAGDAVAEIETDKSTLELSAATAGRLGGHRVGRGESVPVGATVTVVLGDGEDEAVLDSTARPTEVAASALSAQPVAGDTSAERNAELESAAEPVGRAPHTMSPRQRRLAAQARSQPQGQARERERSAVPTRPADGVRASIARQVSRSWAEIPHFAVARDVDADGVLERLATEARDGDNRISVTDVLIRALGRALAPRGSSDVGLAVATSQGVLLPVLPVVAPRTLADIAHLRRAAVERAQERRSIDDDTRTPLVTLSNLGSHAVRWFTGVIPLGQQGLLTTGTLEQRAVVRSGRLAVAWQLSAILNVDHRSWDGADAAELLRSFAHEIESYGRYADVE